MNNEELIARIEVLERWKAEKEKQQIKLPFDIESRNVLNQYFVSILESYAYTFDGGVGGNTFSVKVFEGSQGGDLVRLFPAEIRYTANPSNDVLTVLNKVNTSKFVDDMVVILYTTGTAPGGLTAGDLTNYHVVSAAADGYSFKLSATQGGAAINITSSGVGRQIIELI